MKYRDRPNVERIVIEYEDGSRKVASGEDAKKWGQWLDGGAALLHTRGREAPNIDYDEKPEWDTHD